MRVGDKEGGTEGGREGGWVIRRGRVGVMVGRKERREGGRGWVGNREGGK